MVYRHSGGGFGELSLVYKISKSDPQTDYLEGDRDFQTDKVTHAHTGPRVSVTAQEHTQRGPGACLPGAALEDSFASRPAGGRRLFIKATGTHLEEGIGKDDSVKLLLLK